MAFEIPKEKDQCTDRKTKLIAKMIVKGNCIICGKPIDTDGIMLCSSCKKKNDEISR